MTHENEADYLKEGADEICRLIADPEYPAIDIVIAVGNLRDWCLAHMPGKEALFEMIYVGRFHRVWRDFRPGEEAPDL